MANTSVVYARIDSELKEIVLKKGIPFELRLPSAEPTAIGGMTRMRHSGTARTKSRLKLNFKSRI